MTSALEQELTKGRKSPVTVALTGGKVGSQVERDKRLWVLAGDLAKGSVGIEEARDLILNVESDQRVDYVHDEVAEPLIWLDVGETAKQEVKSLIKDAPRLGVKGADYIIHATLSTSVERSGPLHLLRDMASSPGEAFEVISKHLIGRGMKAVLDGSFLGGLAVWKVREKRGAYGSCEIPFTFSALKDSGEVENYLRMLAFRGLTLDKWMMMRGWTIGSDDEVEQILRLRGSRSPQELALFNERAVLYASQHCSDAVNVGIEEVKNYPGGVALEVLADMGKVQTVDGRDFGSENFFDFFSYSLNGGSLDLGDREIMVLLEAMRGGARGNIASVDGRWIKVVDLRDKSIRYPVYKFQEWIRKQLERPIKDIWVDRSLPINFGESGFCKSWVLDQMF